ncbi:tRNA-specific adenosine deaminase 1 [Wyeomyia smithii]|uniref:tRNA-specific adenosine deaminase 1 n=1 Tax=Wyeomyia smithii TaxID=174621 RepID=UPI002467CB86|nr:tRNA-specific adenosine deaminase 1 [Wyeomyia smithii]
MAPEEANKIAKICLEKFDSLPKTGKPKIDFEWTILSAMVQLERKNSEVKMEVVALGTGTKCLGSDQLSPKGDMLNDSHAEVLTRRAFLRYLLKQMKKSLTEECSIFEYNSLTRLFRLKKDVSFDFFTTHSPCGDASIFKESDVDHEPLTKKMKFCETHSCESETGSKAADGMTGGKLVASDGDDLMSQEVGLIRTKPGKGFRTLSLSCSDKMARWNILGVQGSLLMMLLEEPIYLKAIVICDGTIYSKEAIERALWKRWDEDTLQGILKPPFRLNRPLVVAASNQKFFPLRKNRAVESGKKFQPAPGGLAWCQGVERELEVENGGRRQGTVKKNFGTPAARLKISKIELFSAFVAMRNELRTAAAVGGTSFSDTRINLSPSGVEQDVADFNGLRYADAKGHSRAYRAQWNTLRAQVFRVWSEKPASLEQFTIDS